MTFSAFFIAMFLVYVSFIEYAQCKDPPLTKFGKKVEKLVPKENFNKIFAVNYKSDEELAKGVEEGLKNLYNILGIPFNEALVQKTDDEDKLLGKSKISPQLIFHAFTYAIQMGLKELGTLNNDNIDDLAQSFADEINKSAEDLKEEDIVSTFKAITTAVGNFLKSQGVTTDDKINVINKYYFQELDKYQGKSSVLGSFLGKALKFLKQFLPSKS